MVVTYYVKLFRTGADRRNGILMSLLLLVAETIRKTWKKSPTYLALIEMMAVLKDISSET